MRSLHPLPVVHMLYLVQPELPRVQLKVEQAVQAFSLQVNGSTLSVWRSHARELILQFSVQVEADSA